MLFSGSRKRGHGLAPLSPCGPSLTLGVELPLDAFFRRGTNGSNPFPSSGESTNPRDFRWGLLTGRPLGRYKQSGDPAEEDAAPSHSITSSARARIDGRDRLPS